MNRSVRGWSLAGTMAAAALFVGCGEAPGDTASEVVDVTMEPLNLYSGTYDPVVAGAPVTVCTVGGVTMHCCPNWQSGRNHYVMVGMNLATNTFRCMRLEATSPHFDAVTLAPATTQHSDAGFIFKPACPTGQAMVGLHWDLKRVACANVSGGGLRLVPYPDTSAPNPSGMKTCLPGIMETTGAGSIMQGIAQNNPNVFRCLH